MTDRTIQSEVTCNRDKENVLSYFKRRGKDTTIVIAVF